MMNKTFLIVLTLFFSLVFVQSATAASAVEVFTIEKEEVVYSTSINKQIESETTKLLNEAKGLVTKIDPIPKTGYLIKVPLTESFSLNNPWIKSSINQAIFVITDEDSPSFMVINEKNQSIFLYFDGDINPLLQAIDFSIPS
ncbi:hypothetical protein JCM19045_1089 [Bacillus sp. JCM 19045]|nr:hypothetical protein JCM19045_1089 [Bacillus sp. JCM 19045]